MISVWQLACRLYVGIGTGDLLSDYLIVCLRLVRLQLKEYPASALGADVMLTRSDVERRSQSSYYTLTPVLETR